jgi:hypothetical protein
MLYHFGNFFIGLSLVYIGINHSESGSLWDACLIIGGIYIGHVITEVFNDPTPESD